jgi:hypothetical protein
MVNYLRQGLSESVSLEHSSVQLAATFKPAAASVS